MTGDKVRLAAIKFAKQNKNRIAKELTDVDKYLPDTIPISIFMAGSPGAGKTEFSKNLIKILEVDNKRSVRINDVEIERRVVRIDGDDIRPLIPGYTGNNSHLFQGAISLIVEKMHDLVLRKKQSFILDGTFANHKKAVENIERSIEKNRPIFIFYIYQKPEVAWRFTQAREEVEGRKILKAAFIEHFLGAKETIDKISKELGNKVTIFFVKKDFEKNTVENIVRIDSSKGRMIDDYVHERYTKDNLKKYL